MNPKQVATLDMTPRGMMGNVAGVLNLKLYP